MQELVYRVLVIDDEPENTLLIRDCLLRHGYEVLTTGHGRNGVLLAMEEQPDLMLLDVHMPVVNR